MKVEIASEVQAALAADRPVVALESTVISHGLPYPQNLELAKELESIIRDAGAVPATIAMIDGKPHAGLNEDQLIALADGKKPVRKLSRRDLAAAVARKEMGATTVATTMMFAHWAGIPVFVTGGIGGVHRGQTGDVSADLLELSQTPVAVVCAGAKAILDLPRTLEWLETFGVPVIGYQAEEFPAFYSRSSGLTLVDSVQTPEEAAEIIKAHWKLKLQNGLLFTVPIPDEAALPPDKINSMIETALADADKSGVTGKDITPFLLSKLVELSGGDSLNANLALLRNNAKVGAEIAVALSTPEKAKKGPGFVYESA